MTAVLASTLTVNTGYVHVSPGLVQATRLPGGFWSVKVRDLDGLTLAFAVPRGVTPGGAFALATGGDPGEVWSLAVRWADSACTLSGRMDRVVFAGHGDALGEQPHDVHELAGAVAA
ncbi:hypothetical protein ABT369_28255 [Dactylosporangium sp. NPDC000244]|uniref:hypothetical protein n=1 Tax=Dactylosporangium sp. NPDC000244 TaxID=3154365 RepID=UPI003324A20B